MLWLEKLAQSDLARAELRLDGYTVSCSMPFEFRLPVAAALRWDLLLTSVSRFLTDRNEFREYQIFFATQETPIALYYGWAKPPAGPLDLEQIENRPDGPLMVLSKSRLD